MNRAEFFKRVDQSDLLEISPNDNPLFRGIKYYGIKENGVKLDYTGEILDIPVNFKSVVSSHVIEHTPNFIEHVNNVSGITNKYYVTLPDYRYCYDHFNHPTSLPDILEAAMQRRERHSVRSLIQHQLHTHNDPIRHWVGDHGEEPVITQDILSKAVTDYISGDYVDCHAWQFTSDSMSYILRELNRLKLINCDFKVYAPQQGTFCFFIEITFKE